MKEAYRKYGVGQMLFDAYVNEAKAKGCAMCKWQVLDWNAPAIAFYDTFQAHFDPEWVNCKLIADQIQNYKFE